MAGGGDWSALPAELLDLVSVHLASERDLLHVRQVCTHWRASVTSRPAAPFRPWVVATRTDPSTLITSVSEYSLWLPRGVRRVQVSGPPDLSYCYGTPRGWLALADNEWSPSRLVLWEPRTGAEIALPPTPTSAGLAVQQVFLSGNPLASPSGWMAVATEVTTNVDHVVSFWRPGDGAWTRTARTEVYCCSRIQSAAFHGGKMYCTESTPRISVYDLDRASASPPVVLGAARLGHARAAHFVTCGGELLLVLLFGYRRHESFLSVHKLDPRRLSKGRQQLDLRRTHRVTDLGGYSLFLGRGECLALSAEEHPAIRRNCVYYVEHYGIRDEHVWAFDQHIWAFVFDLKSKAVEEIPFPPEHMENRKKQWWPCSWFCPEKPVMLKRH